MSNETLFYFINAVVPAGWAVNLEANLWRYSIDTVTKSPEKKLQVWLKPPEGTEDVEGRWIHGTPQELLEAVRAKFPLPLPQAA